MSTNCMRISVTTMLTPPFTRTTRFSGTKNGGTDGHDGWPMVWANTAFGLALNADASRLTGVGPVVLTKVFELPHALAAHAKTTGSSRE